MVVNRKFLSRGVLLVVLVIVVAGMVVPYGVIEYALRHFGHLKQLTNFIDTVAPGFEMFHLLAFGAVGFAARIAWRNGSAWLAGIGCLAIASLVEFLQIWIPGRDAAVVHAILNVLGGVAGFAFASVLIYAWGIESRHTSLRHPATSPGESSQL